MEAKTMSKSLFASMIIIGLMFHSTSHAQHPEVAFSVGNFEVFESSNRATEIGAEYRFRPAKSLFNIVPAVGLSANSDGGYWAHAGIRYDISLSDKWLFTPQLAAVGYENGGGKNLGSGFLFRSGIELGYKLNANNKIALTLYHLSNGGLGNRNPGAESLIFSYSFTPHSRR
jgi:lipid A 3-O-deacylase